MSYCRFGWGGSDVYVYESVDGIECCGCNLDDNFTAACGCEADTDPRHSEAALAMVLHLRRHREAGHNVPLGAAYTLSVEAGVWTRERAWAEVVWRWRAVKRRVCWVVGHRPVPSFPIDEIGGLPDMPYRDCGRCGRSGGYLGPDGVVRWLY